MKPRIALYLFLVATLCMGCGGRITMHRLEQLESRVNENSDKAMKDKIFAKVETEIERFQSGKELPKIEAIVNRHLDNVMARLRTEIPYLKETDYTYLIYFYARFSGKAISLFTGTKRDTVYKIKERLCNKIKASDAPGKDFFLSKLQ